MAWAGRLQSLWGRLLPRYKIRAGIPLYSQVGSQYLGVDGLLMDRAAGSPPLLPLPHPQLALRQGPTWRTQQRYKNSNNQTLGLCKYSGDSLAKIFSLNGHSLAVSWLFFGFFVKMDTEAKKGPVRANGTGGLEP